MAIDPKQAAGPVDTGPTSIIENEIPTYRAISSAAVFSLLLGIASFLCFTHVGFIGVAIAAVLVGVLALRGIDRRSDVLTGSNLARVGITLGLVCGIAAFTSNVVQAMMLKRESTQFASDFVEVLKNEPMAVALWYHQPPGVRSDKKPDEVVEELKKAAQGPAGDAYATQSTPVLKIKEIVKAKGDVHFEKIETSLYQGLTAYANALLEVHNPSAKDPAEKEAFARLRIRRDAANARNEWTVEELEYPYKPASYVEKVAAPDDGHGHGSH
ncbi:DUF4190 domain-containing protein [Tundrisphaera sp. TA3]|uniref:DUF4190 domain-containing protein n=1 Tax=Tundrisphaera sp. TA3 TaxID=3435775 RepID=UPI003EBF448D